MKTLFIRDLSNSEIVVDLVVGVFEAKVLTDKNGNNYYDVTFIDSSAKIKGKIWSDKFARIDQSSLAEGSVVRVSGKVTEFRSELQLTIDDLFSVKEGDYDLRDLVQTPSKPIDELWNKVIESINLIKNLNLKNIIDICIEKYQVDIKMSPAAEKLHHAYQGGLIEHYTEMLGIIDKFQEFYPDADYDLVRAGIFFHDIGKIKELAVDGFVMRRTDEGKLISHISISYEIFLECMPKDFDPMLKLKLGHIILSHHGLLEYGSPVVPKTLEAIIVSKIDDLSSAVRQFKRVIDESEGGESFSKKDWALGTDVYLK